MSRTVRSLEHGIQRCKRCERHDTRRHAVPGEGPSRTDVFLVGEAPGRQEDYDGRPFVGRAGRYLDRMLARYGFERDQIYITSVLKCWQEGPPRRRQINSCLAWTRQQLAAVNPRYVLIMGRVAECALLDELLRPGPSGRQNLTVVTTSHPAAAMRFPQQHRRFRRALRRVARLRQRR